MANTIVCMLLSLFFVSSVRSTEEGFISIDVSEKGLDFVKDSLIEKAVSSLTRFPLPQIEKAVKIAVIGGNVQIILSDITINRIDVPSSIIKSGETGITIVASGATANLSLAWRYSYSTWLLPIAISDKGDAFVQVEGMEVGLTLGLENQQGNLKLSLLECGCYVKDISIKLDGGASWLYQGVADAFEENIASAVEDAVSSKIKDGIINVDSLLKSIPKEIPIDNIAAINVTFVNDPVLSNSSVGLQIDGLFTEKDEIVVSNLYHKSLQVSDSCKGLDKMIGISFHEKVLNSAVFVYFDGHSMQWIVDQIPDQSLLNTAGWRYVVPQLYKQFPNDDMKLNISVSSPPIIKIEKQNVDVTVYLDVTVDVVDAGEVIPVACISMVVSASGFAKISRNKLAGRVQLSELTMHLEWSKIGNLHMSLIKSFMSAALKTVILPYGNFHLKRGFPLPLFCGYKLENAQVVSIDSRIMICSDVASSGEYNLNHLALEKK